MPRTNHELPGGELGGSTRISVYDDGSLFLSRNGGAIPGRLALSAEQTRKLRKILVQEQDYADNITRVEDENPQQVQHVFSGSTFIIQEYGEDYEVLLKIHTPKSKED